MEWFKLWVVSIFFVVGVLEGDGCMVKFFICFLEECYCNFVLLWWSLDGSVSIDECFGDFDVIELDGSFEDDVSDYGIVKLFVVDVFDFEEDLSENFVDFLLFFLLF